MLYFDGFAGLLLTGLWIFSFIDVLLTPESACRNLPKLAWVFLVLLLPPLGPIGWMVAGRPWNTTGAASRASSSRFPEYDRPNRFVPSNPDDDEEFLAGLRKRAEDQRRRARDQDDTPDTV